MQAAGPVLLAGDELEDRDQGAGGLRLRLHDRVPHKRRRPAAEAPAVRQRRAGRAARPGSAPTTSWSRRLAARAGRADEPAQPVRAEGRRRRWRRRSRATTRRSIAARRSSTTTSCGASRPPGSIAVTACAPASSSGSSIPRRGRSSPSASSSSRARAWAASRPTSAAACCGTDGTPIGGLYAVGEAAGFGGGGIHGVGSLEGTFLGGCVLTGTVTGRAMSGGAGGGES